MWVCFEDIDYTIAMRKLNQELEDEGSSPHKIHGYKVGFYKPNGDFHRWDHFEYRSEAEAMVHYLNGGSRG
tara:strand:+ start:1361 stop:1573 length:213 start_codon:yes stop_codon:yes gene_type:complete